MTNFVPQDAHSCSWASSGNGPECDGCTGVRRPKTSAVEEPGAGGRDTAGSGADSSRGKKEGAAADVPPASPNAGVLKGYFVDDAWVADLKEQVRRETAEGHPDPQGRSADFSTINAEAIKREATLARGSVSMTDLTPSRSLDAIGILTRDRDEWKRRALAVPSSSPAPRIPGWSSPSSLTKDEVIETICRTLDTVWQHFDPEGHESNDCVCGKSNWHRPNPKHFRSSGQAVVWIQDLVRETLATLKGCPDGSQ